MKPARPSVPFAIMIFVLSIPPFTYGRTPSMPPLFAVESFQGGDLAIFDEAIARMRDRHYKQGRRLLKRFIASDNPLIPSARLIIADSYFREGGFYNLRKAEAEYRDWLKDFPGHRFTPAVMLKIVESNLKRGRLDKYGPFRAEKILLELQTRFPRFKKDVKVQEYSSIVQEVLADHELKVAKFYFELKNNFEVVRLRLLQIVDNRPLFSRMDAALWYLGLCEEARENPDKALEYYERIARKYPNSEFRYSALGKLERFGRVAPEPDDDTLLSERSAKLPVTLEEIWSYCAAIPSNGVLLDENDHVDHSLIYESQNYWRSSDEIRWIVKAINWTAFLSFL